MQILQIFFFFQARMALVFKPLRSYLTMKARPTHKPEKVSMARMETFAIKWKVQTFSFIW